MRHWKASSFVLRPGQVTASVKLQQCRLATAAICRIQVCGLRNRGCKGEKKTASTHRPSGVCTLAKLGFQVFILCADVCLHPLIPARSGFCLCQLSLLCFGFVSYVLRQDIALIAKKQFVFFACIFGRRSNGLKFRSGLPVAAILRCGSA